MSFPTTRATYQTRKKKPMMEQVVETKAPETKKRKRTDHESDRTQRSVVLAVFDANRTRGQVYKMFHVMLAEIKEHIGLTFFKGNCDLQSAPCIDPTSKDKMGVWYWIEHDSDVMVNRTCQAWQEDASTAIRGRCVLVTYPSNRKNPLPRDLMRRMNETQPPAMLRLTLKEPEPTVQEAEEKVPEPKKKRGTNGFIEFTKRSKDEHPSLKWSSLTKDEQNVYNKRAQKQNAKDA